MRELTADRHPVSWRIYSAVNPDLPVKGIRGWQRVTAQVLLIALAFVLYLVVRALTIGSESIAFGNARRLLEWEYDLGIAWERGAQTLILDSELWIETFNFIYVWLYWPTVLGALVFLYLTNKRRYVLYRNALFFSGAIGLVIFASFPVAPPRFLDGFTDTVSDLSRSHFVARPSGFANEFAAMPSFHVGWVVLAGVILFMCTRSWWTRAFTLVPGVAMSMAVVFTANHYIVDGIAGVAICVTGLLLAVWLQRAVDRRAARHPEILDLPLPS
jgi:hypothetical protein